MFPRTLSLFLMPLTWSSCCLRASLMFVFQPAAFSLSLAFSSYVLELLSMHWFLSILGIRNEVCTQEQEFIANKTRVHSWIALFLNWTQKLPTYTPESDKKKTIQEFVIQLRNFSQFQPSQILLNFYLHNHATIFPKCPLINMLFFVLLVLSWHDRQWKHW